MNAPVKALRHLVIVARHQVQLYDYLRARFRNENVEVILDRRVRRDRRKASQPVALERRRQERRGHFEPDPVSRTESVQFVTIR